MEPLNPKTGMTHEEAREFIRNHFEEFVNRKNVQIGNVNFAAVSLTMARTCRQACLPDLPERFNM